MKLILGIIVCGGCCAFAAGRAAWMHEAKFGVMTHYLAEWIAPDAHSSVEAWNAMVNGFDAEGLSAQLAEAGAGYHLITIGQNSGFYIAPNAAYDRLTGIRPSKLSRRDLVAALYEAHCKRGIRLIVYLPSGAPSRDRAATEALGWRNGPYANREFQEKWEQVIREWSRRWGTKVSGWWFDGCYFPNTMYRSPRPPNFASFAAAARAGNPNSALAFNRGVFYPLFSLTEQEDYIAGEVNEPERATVNSRYKEGILDGARIHMLSFLGATWGKGGKRFTDAQVVAYTRAILDRGGAVTWDAPVQRSGLIAAPFMDQLKALGKELGIRRATNAGGSGR